MDKESNDYPKYHGVPNFSEDQHLFKKVSAEEIEFHRDGTLMFSFKHHHFLYIIEIPHPEWGNQPDPIIQIKDIRL